jgi:sirohydrochlorin ferrochelatase
MDTNWQDKIAVVLAAHGDRGEAHATGRANATLLAHRDRLRENSRFACVTAGVLKGDLALEAALREADLPHVRHIAVFPMFMADGYFVRRILPQRISDAKLSRPVTQLRPLGLDPELFRLIAERAERAAQDAGYQARSSRLLIVGHGSELGPDSANATAAAVEALRARSAFLEIAAAFLEEPPFLAEALADRRLSTVVAGFMSGDGLHAGEDIPAAIAESGAEAVYSGSIGNSPEVPNLILKTIEQALAPT